MTIGVPIVTCLHRVRQIHKANQKSEISHSIVVVEIQLKTLVREQQNSGHVVLA